MIHLSDVWRVSYCYSGVAPCYIPGMFLNLRLPRKPCSALHGSPDTFVHSLELTSLCDWCPLPRPFPCPLPCTSVCFLLRLLAGVWCGLWAVGRSVWGVCCAVWAVGCWGVWCGLLGSCRGQGRRRPTLGSSRWRCSGCVRE